MWVTNVYCTAVFFLHSLISSPHYKKRQFLYRRVPCGELYTLNTRPNTHCSTFSPAPSDLARGKSVCVAVCRYTQKHFLIVPREGLCMWGPARGGEMETWRPMCTAFYAKLYSLLGGFWIASCSNSCFCKAPDSGWSYLQFHGIQNTKKQKQKSNLTFKKILIVQICS